MEMNNVTSISRSGKDIQGGGEGDPHMYPSPVIAVHSGGRGPRQLVVREAPGMAIRRGE